MSPYKLGYEIVLNLSDILEFIMTAWILSITVRLFMEKGKRTWPVGMAYFLTLLTERYILWEMEAMFAYGIAAAVALGMMYILDKTYVGQKIFLAVTFYSMNWQMGNIGSCMTKWSYAISLHLPGYLWNYRYQFIVYVISTILIQVSEELLLFGAAWILCRIYRYKKEVLSGRELVMLLLPSFSSLLGYAVIRYYLTIYVWNAGISTLTVWGINDIAEPLFDLFSLAAILVMAKVFTDNKTRQKEEKQQEMLTNQVNNIKVHIAQVEKLYQDMRSLRHDMGNHMMTLMSLQEQGEYTQAGGYLSKLREQMQEDTIPVKSGNPVTDVILAEKKRDAEEKGILFDSHFFYPADTGINAFDISVILYNALDNAIEAVIRSKPNYGSDKVPDNMSDTTDCSNAEEIPAAWIRLTSYRRQNAYVIEVENSFHGTLKWDIETGLPLTTKVNTSGHGFGLGNIQRIAQNYYGTLDTDWTKERFRLRVLLQIPGSDLPAVGVQ